MANHADVLDQQDSLRGPLMQSVLLHGALIGAFVAASISYEHSHLNFGSTQTSAGSAVAVTAVKSIPLPARNAHVNPVANNTDSQVQQPEKVQPKKQVKAPEEKAIPLFKSRRVVKAQPRQQSLQRFHYEEPKDNQVFSRQAPAAASPMFQKPGTGGVGVGPNSAFGTQFGGYATLVIQRVTDKWLTNGLAGLNLPIVVVTFDIMRDGSVRNAKIAQRSGNTNLDYSALRAVNDAAPFPPLPPNYSGNSASVELQFQLQQ